MIVKPTTLIELSDIEALVGNAAEDRYIDFKQAPVGRADADRKDFIADVTAFANASGGHIIFGIVEGQDAVASQITGITIADRDQEERRLSDMIRTGTEPRLSEFEFKWLDEPIGKSILVLHVPRSWRSPHRVTLAGHNQFYVRNSRGKHPMNTDELRAAFTYGQALEERVARFRRDRIEVIRKQEAPTTVDTNPIMIVHAIPLVSLADPPTISFSEREVLQSPLGGGGYNYAYTLEGPVTYNPQSAAYTIHFRNGIIEGLAPCRGSVTPKGGISLTGQENVLWTALRGYFRYWQDKNVRGPYVFYVSLLNVKGYAAIINPMLMDEAEPMRRNELDLPAQLLSDADKDADARVLLRPTFDLLWNGFGHARSPNYDHNGHYVAR
jgi:hypothetical protein